MKLIRYSDKNRIDPRIGQHFLIRAVGDTRLMEQRHAFTKIIRHITNGGQLHIARFPSSLKVRDLRDWSAPQYPQTEQSGVFVGGGHRAGTVGDADAAGNPGVRSMVDGRLSMAETLELCLSNRDHGGGEDQPLRPAQSALRTPHSHRVEAATGTLQPARHPAAFARVSSYSASGTESATMPAPAW